MLNHFSHASDLDFDPYHATCSAGQQNASTYPNRIELIGFLTRKAEKQYVTY